MVNLAKKFTGKKLLLLGTNPGTCDMVNYARSQRAYVIVTDNLPTEKSAAKQIADEAWLVSTADVDALEQLAIQHQINGIFAGVSDFNLEKALTLCERLDLPFYCTRQQWEICNDKQSFKQLCLANDIPAPREYKLGKPEDLRAIKYPVIVKPVDRSAGTGIRICHNENELQQAYIGAVSLSKSKQAIVEEFIEGNEFMARYTIKDGKFSLSYTVDKYFNLGASGTMPLPQINILPSKYTDRYLDEVNNKVIDMFQNIGLMNGFIVLQAIINNNGFYFFEMNYRIDGLLLYRIISRINTINYMEMFINYALTGKMDGYDLNLDNPKFNKCCCTLELMSNGGTIGNIIGLEENKQKKSLLIFEKMYNIGDYVEYSGTLNQAILRFYLVEDSLQELKNSIKEIQATVKVLDDKGNDMLLPPFNTDRI